MSDERLSGALARYRVRKDLPTNSGGLLAPGVSWEQLEERLGRHKDQIEKTVKAYLRDEDFFWLRGNVGGAKELFERNRGQILAEGQFQTAMATYARIPHESAPFYDPEAGSSPDILGQEINLNRTAAASGLEDLAYDLAEKVRSGLIDKLSLSFYWVAWPETVQKVTYQMKEKGLVIPAPLGEFYVDPELVEWVNKKM